MNRFITAAVTAAALFTATAAHAEIQLQDRQIVSKNGTPLGTLYLVIDTEGQDDVFAVMDGGMAFPPPMDFVLLAANTVEGEAPADAPLRQVNTWAERADSLLHKGVDDGDCGTIYQSLYRVAEVTVLNGIYRPTNDFVALMGEQNACADEGRLRWFVDADSLPSNQRPVPGNGAGGVDLYFESIEEFGPVVAEHTWYARSWMPPATAE